MERMEVYFVRILNRFLDDIVNIITYLLLLALSIAATVGLLEISPVLKFISTFDSPFSIFIIYAIIVLIFSIYYSSYVYMRFMKYHPKVLSGVFFVLLTVVAAAYVLKQLYQYELGGSLSELFEYTRYVLLILYLVLSMTGFLLFSSLVREWTGGHKINTHFIFAGSAIKDLEKIKNNKINNYKDLYTLHSVSVEYTRGIRDVKNLLIRGIDPNRFFDSNTELSLNEILDWLVFSMQYYLFHGGSEQLEAAKEHLKRMAIYFDEDYHIDTDQFMYEILRMHNEINGYFKENNVFIARSIKFTDRVVGYLPQALLAIIPLVISILIKNYTLN